MFPAKFVDKDLFLNIYGQVCTRCFGHGTETCTMIPGADNLNHSSVGTNQELVSTNLHLNALSNESYFRIGKMFNNYSILYEKQMSEEERDKHKQAIQGRFDREQYQANMEHLSTDTISQQLRSTDKQIWELPYYLDEFAEDNDSSQEEDESNEEENNKFAMVLGEKRRQVKLREGHGLEFFVNMEMKYLAKMRNKRAEAALEDLHLYYRELLANSNYTNEKAL